MFPATVTISYELLGKKMTAQQTVSVSVANRNSFRWNDPSSLSSFVSPNTSEILELSKYVSGLARQSLVSGLNQNIQTAIWITESVNAMRIACVKDGSSPYVTAHSDTTLPDQIQLPYQTLAFKSADYDGKGILLASLFEAAGIDAAYIPLANDFIVAFSIGSVDAAETVVKNLDEVVIVENEAWIPLSIGSLQDGFGSSWEDAIDEINNDQSGGLEITIVREAWQLYVPAGWSEKSSYTKPEPPELKRRADKEVASYQQNEILPIISRVRSEIAENPTGKNWNKLGLVYVKLGQYANAKEAFTVAINKEYDNALCNLANVYLLQKNYTEAERLYKVAIGKNPESTAAAKGLDRVKAERGK